MRNTSAPSSSRKLVASILLTMVFTACNSDSILTPTIQPLASESDPAPAVSRSIIGTYAVSYYLNAGGCFGDPNPYFCVNIAPGPIHIPLPAGCYQVKVLSGLTLPGNASVWDGTSLAGRYFGLNPATPRVRFEHHSGDVTLYHFDWFPWDNDPSAVWTFELSRLGSATTC